LVERFLKIFQTPRLWLTAGVVCFAASIIVGYHQDQIAADSVLAEKVPSPPVVLIQDFDPGLHSNLLREVRFLAEADVSRSIRRNVGSESVSKIVEIVPVFPVTSISAPLAASVLNQDAPRRPVGRSAVPALRAAAQGLSAIERTPVGLILSEASVADDLVMIGDGLNGPLVEFFGAEIGNGEIFSRAVDEFSGVGLYLMDDIPVVWLYPAGERPLASARDFTFVRNALLLAVFISVVAGALLAALRRHRERIASKQQTFEEVPAVGEFPGVYSTMHRDDEERIREEQDASERRAARTRRVMSRVVGG
jgi:hypothetical protein